MVIAYVLINVNAGSERAVCKRLSTMKEVVEVGELYGEYDIMMKVETSVLPELDTFLTEKVRSIPDVRLTSTMIVASQYKIARKTENRK